jgi:hypothetical protein
MGEKIRNVLHEDPCTLMINLFTTFLQKIFKNKNISKNLKLKLKNTIIDKTLTYAPETWMLTKRE